MKSYARIDNGSVAELFDTDAKITDLFAPGLVWIEIPEGSYVTTGWSYSDGSFSAPSSPTLNDAKIAQTAILVADYNAAIQQPVSYMGTTFQADSDSQTKVIQVLAAMTPAGATPAGFYWVDAANDHVAMTLAQVQGLSQAMMAQGWAAFQHLQARKAAVNAATTIPDVQAVVW
jgi:hypothetical protein